MIKKQKKEIKELKEMMIMERKCMQYEVDDAEQEITDLKKENKVHLKYHNDEQHSF